MVLRVWVPLSHRLWARNWNRAASGAALTASRVANRVAVSTPLRVGSVTVLVMWVSSGWPAQVQGSDRALCGGGQVGLAGNGGGGQVGGLGVEGVAEPFLQVDEVRD